MEEQAARAAAELIWDLWQRGDVAGDLPPQSKPATREEGYAIQEQLELLEGHRVAGWKIAASNAAGQAHIGVDGPIAGRIFADMVLVPGATVAVGTNRMRVAEPEFVFRFGSNIEPSSAAYTVDDVMAQVSELHLALELPDSRFEDFASVGGPTLIAESACARDLVLGPAVAGDWRALDLSQHSVTGHVAGRIEREGSGANVLGDPRVALTWLVNELCGHGITIEAGQFVTTGTTMVPLEIVEGDDVMADFGELGQVQVYIGA